MFVSSSTVLAFVLYDHPQQNLNKECWICMYIATAILRSSWTEMNAVRNTAFQMIEGERKYDMAHKALKVHSQYCWHRVAGPYSTEAAVCTN